MNVKRNIASLAAITAISTAPFANAQTVNKVSTSQAATVSVEKQTPFFADFKCSATDGARNAVYGVSGDDALNRARESATVAVKEMEGVWTAFNTIKVQCFKKVEDGKLIEAERPSVPKAEQVPGATYNILPARYSEATYVPL